MKEEAGKAGIEWLAHKDANWQAVPQVAARMIELTTSAEEVKVDGKLGEQIWSSAAEAGRFADSKGPGEEALDWAKVKFVATKDGLIVGAHLQAPPSGPVASVTTNGGRVWRDHALQIELAPTPGKDPIKVIVNAKGVYYAERGTQIWPGTVVSSASLDGSSAWQAEVLLPWKDLGLSPDGSKMVPVQLRYLLPEGAGSMSLVSAETPREWPRLRLNAGEKKENEGVVLKEFSFPGSFSGGDLKVGARWSGGQKGSLITLSVSNRSGKEPVVVKEETFEVGGGEQEALMTVPADAGGPSNYSLSILSQQASSGSPQELFSHQQLVVPRNRLEWQVDRERLWAGDAEVGGRVFYTPGAGSADSAELKLALWNATHRLAEATVKASDLAVLPFKVTTSGLGTGEYRLVLSDGAGAEMARELSFGLAMPLPAKSKIALPVDWPDAARAVKSWPVYVGVSFPGGTLMDERLVRVVDQAGKEVPCQTEVLARWGPQGSIKWMGFSFNGAPNQSYFAEFGSDVKRSASESAKVTVKEAAEAILIDTGAARFELPSKGPLLSKAWLGDRLAVENREGVLTVRDQKDNEGSEIGGGIEEAPRVEVAGPQRVVVRREGFLRDAKGKEMGRYIVRLTFSAGQTVVPMQHAFVMTRNSNQMQVKEIAVRMRPAFAAPWQAAFDVAGEDGKAGWEVVQNLAANEDAWLFQEVFPHHRQTTSRFTLGRGAQKLKEGAMAGESAAVWGGDCGVGITVPNLARLFPKEISVSSAGLVAKLWSSRGGRVLDYGPGAIADHVGDEWLDKSYPGGSKAFRSQRTGDAAGTGRTHDLVLFLTPGGGNALAGAQAAGEAAAQPPFLCQDPQWLHQTKAMGPLQPYDPKQFPRQEAFLRQFFEHFLIGQAERFGDHGFLDVGAGPHTWNNDRVDPGAGKDWPRLNYRYSNMDYGMRTSSWLAYARSGQRNYRTYADAISRHFYDFKFSHWELPGKPLGAELNGLTSEENMLYWTGVPGRVPAAGGHQAFDVLNHLYQFYLTGDRRALDVTLNFGKYMQRAFDPAVLPNIGATAGNFRAYGCAAILYAQTWDPAYVRLVQEARARLVDLRTTTGLVNQDYYGAYYKHSARAWGVLQDYWATGDSLAGKVILKMSDYLVQGEPTHTAGYQDHDASFFQVAYDLSKDQRFADWINTRINRLTFAYTTADGKLRGAPLEGGNHTANVLEVVAYGLDLVNRTRADIRPRPLFTQLTRARDAWLAIEKPESQDVALELTTDRTANLSILSIANPERRDWFGGYTGVLSFDWSPLVPTLDYPGLRSGYGRAVLPLEMLGGLYRLDGVESIISHRGGRVALVAPHGLYYDAAQVDAAPLWFTIPAGTSGTVTVNRPASLDIDGKKIDLPAGQPVTLAGAGEEKAAALTTQAGTIYVRLGGDIPPVFARDRRDLFLPPQAGKPAPLPAPDAGAAPFAAGSGGGANDRAFRLKTEGLQFPRGTQTGDGSFQYFDMRRGTLEFWFKPAWSSALLPATKKTPMLTASNWYLTFQAAQSEFMSTGKRELMALAGSNVEWTVTPQPPARQPQRLVLPFDFWQDRWYHVAMSWDTRPEVGWVSELYVDGQPALIWNRTGVMTRFQSGIKGEKLTDWKPADPGEFFLLPAGLDGWVDQIRVSNFPRYEAPFAPPAAGSLQPDKDTLLYLPLDGTLDGVAQPGVPVPKASTRK